jgi:hypothetical protein
MKTAWCKSGSSRFKVTSYSAQPLSCYDAGVFGRRLDPPPISHSQGCCCPRVSRRAGPERSGFTRYSGRRTVAPRPCLSPHFHTESRSHAGTRSSSACQRSTFGYRTGRDGTGSRFAKRLGRLSGGTRHHREHLASRTFTPPARLECRHHAADPQCRRLSWS